MGVPRARVFWPGCSQPWLWTTARTSSSSSASSALSPTPASNFLPLFSLLPFLSQCVSKRSHTPHTHHRHSKIHGPAGIEQHHADQLPPHLSSPDDVKPSTTPGSPLKTQTFYGQTCELQLWSTDIQMCAPVCTPPQPQRCFPDIPVTMASQRW